MGYCVDRIARLKVGVSLPNAKSLFRARFLDAWLPSYCNAPHRKFSPGGFDQNTLNKVAPSDAYWFLRAIDLGLILEQDGFFVAPMSKAKEQIVWEGSKNVTPRPLSLWLEPIITIGALARLHEVHGWPKERLGMQSKDYAFDLLGYSSDGKAIIACEVKKAERELDQLIARMKKFMQERPASSADVESSSINAFRKVQSLVRSPPDVFWAVGPGGHEKVFLVEADAAASSMRLMQGVSDLLDYKS